MATEQSFIQICSSGELVRETYYSKTYRANFKLNGLLQAWDVTHISVPFAPDKEQALIQKLGIRNEESLIEFYQDFMQRLRREQELFREIQTFYQEAPEKSSLDVAFASYRVRKSFQDDQIEWGRSYYLVSEPMDPIIGSEFIQNRDQISLCEVATLGERVTEALASLRGTHIHIGAWNLAETYVSRCENGKKCIIIGSLLYGGKDGDTLPQLGSVPETAHESVRKGEPPSLSADLYSVGAVLWNLCSGRHWSESPNLSEKPTKATNKLIEILQQCLAGGDEDVLRRVNADLCSMAKEIKELPDSFNPKIMLAPTPDCATENEVDTGTETEVREQNSATDPMLEGMQLVEAAFYVDEQEDFGLEFVDVPLDIIRDEASVGPQFRQRAPLAPRQRKIREAENKGTRTKKLPVKPILVGVAVLAIGLFGWSKIYMQTPSAQNSQEEVLEQVDMSDGADDEVGANDGDILGPTIEAETPDGEDTNLNKEEAESSPADTTTQDEIEMNTGSSSSSKPSTGSSSSSKPSTGSSSSSKPSTGSSSSSKPSTGGSSSSKPSTGGSSSSKPSTGGSSSSGTGGSSSSGSGSGSSSSSGTGGSSSSGSGNSSSSGTGGSSSSGSGSSSSSGTTRPLQPNFSVSPGSVSISVGGSVALSANAPCSFSTSNSAVAYVSGRSVIGVAAGTCTITAVSAVDGTVRTIVVSVH